MTLFAGCSISCRPYSTHWRYWFRRPVVLSLIVLPDRNVCREINDACVKRHQMGTNAGNCHKQAAITAEWITESTISRFDQPVRPVAIVRFGV